MFVPTVAVRGSCESLLFPFVLGGLGDSPSRRGQILGPLFFLSWVTPTWFGIPFQSCFAHPPPVYLPFIMIVTTILSCHSGWHFRKFKVQSSNVSFVWNMAKETFELWALSFETVFENVSLAPVNHVKIYSRAGHWSFATLWQLNSSRDDSVGTAFREG